MNAEKQPVLILPTEQQQERFNLLASEWETSHATRPVSHIVQSPILEEVYSMGPAAIQPILDRLSRGVTLWYFPLKKIIRDFTGEEVEREAGDFYVPQDRHSLFEGERRALLQWGENNGYAVILEPVSRFVNPDEGE